MGEFLYVIFGYRLQSIFSPFMRLVVITLCIKTSEEGLRHPGRRCIESEAVFGQMKFSMAYRCFRHFGKDKVTMGFAFFAIAFNIKKMCSKIAKQTKNEGYTPHFGLFIHIYIESYRLRIDYLGKSQKTVA